jgi:hypothetical protein
MRAFLTFIVLLTFGHLFGQNFTYPIIKKKGTSVNDFVPVGWIIRDSVMGDLNNDKLIDIVLILQHVDTVTLTRTEDDITDTVKTQPRILAVLFRDSSDKVFHLKEQSNSFILTHDDIYADDPYQSVVIEKGILKIDFYWYPTSGNWFNTHSYKFRYQEKKFYLIGGDYEEANKATHDYSKYSYNFLTGKMIFTEGNRDKKTAKSETSTFHFNTLQTIETLKTPYNWEVGNGVSF